MKVRLFLFFGPKPIAAGKLLNSRLVFAGQLEMATNKQRAPKPKPKYDGMTVNERLFVSGLLERFRAVALRRNRRGMITILKRLAVSEKYAAQWVDAMLGDPKLFYR
jgi:hypothetical protein